MKEVIQPWPRPPHHGVYSLGFKCTNPNTIIFLAGQVSEDEKGNILGKGDVYVQTKVVHENMKKVLEAAGGKMKDVVKTTIFCKKEAYKDRKEIIRARNEVFEDPHPANTFVVVESLASPDYLLEVEGIAVVD